MAKSSAFSWKGVPALLVLLGQGALADDMHRAQGEGDPYAGFQRPNGSSCCGNQDCRPAPWDEQRGLIGMPDGTWVDPWTVPNVGLYYSFDGNAHVCARKTIFCLFVPGSSAAR